MKKISIACFTGLAGLFSAVALGAPGEYWEHTTKMEMPGMPFAMPAMTNKVCVGKGEEKNPGKSSKDKDCEMTDIKISGNKTSWKVRCNQDGQVMTGSGEQTTSKDSYRGTMHLTGKDMDMTQTYSGKRVGGACDTGEAAAKMNQAVAKVKGQVCDTSDYKSTSEWIAGSAMMLGKDALCANKKEQLCSRVRKDAPHDASTYQSLLDNEKFARQSNGGVVPVSEACGVNMAATLKSLCKEIDEDNYEELSAYCPAEVKAKKEQWRQERIAKRKKHCEAKYTDKKELEACLEGRSFTSMSYTSGEPEENVSKAIPGMGGDKPAAAVLEGAKKLKGLFGF